MTKTTNIVVTNCDNHGNSDIHFIIVLIRLCLSVFYIVFFWGVFLYIIISLYFNDYIITYEVYF